jgi:hypothetical protein
MPNSDGQLTWQSAVDIIYVFEICIEAGAKVSKGQSIHLHTHEFINANDEEGEGRGSSDLFNHNMHRNRLNEETQSKETVLVFVCLLAKNQSHQFTCAGSVRTHIEEKVNCDEISSC